MNRKQFAATTVLFIGVSLPVLAVDQKAGRNRRQHYVPRLNDIMVSPLQLRHFRIYGMRAQWKTGRWQNMS